MPTSSIELYSVRAHVGVHLWDIRTMRWRRSTPLFVQPLLANAESFDHDPVTRVIHTTEIVQQPSSTSDQLQQSTPRVMIFFMGLEVFGEIGDPVRQDCNLHFRRSRILVVLLI